MPYGAETMFEGRASKKKSYFNMSATRLRYRCRS